MSDPSKLETLSPVKRRLLEKLLARRRAASTVALNPARAPVVPLQTRGHRAPLFCVHPILGVIFPYYELAVAMESEHPFYGIQSFGEDGALISARGMEDIAGYYVREVKRVQPAGPYYLSGWSFGSMAAYEMARQLVAQGDEVALLALFDTWAPGSGSAADVARFGTSVARDIWALAYDYHELRTAGRRQADEGAASRWLRRLAGLRSPLSGLGRQGVAGDGERPPSAAPLLHAYHVNTMAVFRYRPEPYSGRLILFRTRRRSRAHARDPSWGWGRLAQGSVEVRYVEGNHMNLMKPPFVASLAEQLSDSLAAAAHAASAVPSEPPPEVSE